MGEDELMTFLKVMHCTAVEARRLGVDIEPEDLEAIVREAIRAWQFYAGGEGGKQKRAEQVQVWP